MKSQDLKISTLQHTLYALQYQGAVTEYGGRGVIGIADVFALRKSGYTHEFEIKVAKSDLMGELKSIKHVANKQLSIDGVRPEKGSQKYTKHSLYIDGDQYGRDYNCLYIPNQFSFVVSTDLLEYAIEGVNGTMYGVYEHTEHGLINKVKGKRIHSVKAPDYILKNMLRKASTEVDYLRRAQNESI